MALVHHLALPFNSDRPAPIPPSSLALGDWPLLWYCILCLCLCLSEFFPIRFAVVLFLLSIHLDCLIVTWDIFLTITSYLIHQVCWDSLPCGHVHLKHLLLEHSFLILTVGYILSYLLLRSGSRFLGIVAAPRDFQGPTLGRSNLPLHRKIKGVIFSINRVDCFL